MKYHRPGLLGYPSSNKAIYEQQRRQLVAYIIKDVLTAAGRRISINAGSVRIRDRLIFFDTRTRRALSTAVYGRMFPRIRRGKFFHYTGIEALENIAASGELRLYSLRKRMQAPIEGELMNLARIEGWNGLEIANEDTDDPDPPGSNMFYTSLTQAVDLWSFGSIRLRLRVNTIEKMGQLREMQYHAAGDVTLLGRINAELDAEKLPPILPELSYRMAAYSAPPAFQTETEIRLLYLHLGGVPDLRRNDGEFDYWPTRLGTSNRVADITLSGIDVNSEKALEQVKKTLEGTGLSAIEVNLVGASSRGQRNVVSPRRQAPSRNASGPK